AQLRRRHSDWRHRSYRLLRASVKLMNSYIVTVTTFLPLVGALALLLHSLFWSRQGSSPEKLDHQYRWIALLVTLVTFVVSLGIVAGFDNLRFDAQLTQKEEWIRALGVSYF